jgi:microcystin-dependent protein
MNHISFAQPNGFPLEADATLGFMQSDYQSGINALAKALGGDYVIVSGCEKLGANYAAGWVVVGSEFLRFEGGAVGLNCFVAQTIVQKPNADGTLVNRYFTRSIKMGDGVGQFGFYQFVRIDSLLNCNKTLQSILNTEGAVIISGCAVDSHDEAALTVDINFGYAYVNGSLKLVPSYSGTYPAYFDGVSWSTVTPSIVVIKFDPFTEQYYADVLSRQLSKIGEVKTFVALSTDFDVTGLGRWRFKGWAICNGQNSTVNMGGRAMVGIDPTGIYTEGSTGGESETHLTTANMPEHNHMGGYTGDAAVNGLGLVYRSSPSGNTTASGGDNIGGGSEPNVINTPQRIPLEGQGLPFSIMPPYRVVIFAQRI